LQDDVSFNEERRAAMTNGGHPKKGPYKVVGRRKAKSRKTRPNGKQKES
jgi:hypothetical protein